MRARLLSWIIRPGAALPTGLPLSDAAPSERVVLATLQTRQIDQLTSWRPSELHLRGVRHRGTRPWCRVKIRPLGNRRTAVVRILCECLRPILTQHAHSTSPTLPEPTRDTLDTSATRQLTPSPRARALLPVVPEVVRVHRRRRVPATTLKTRDTSTCQPATRGRSSGSSSVRMPMDTTCFSRRRSAGTRGEPAVLSSALEVAPVVLAPARSSATRTRRNTSVSTRLSCPL